MTLQARTKLWLQDHRVEVVLPPDRRLPSYRYARVRRFDLPVGGSTDAAHRGQGVFIVDLDRMMNRIGYSYAEGGWHPFVAALDEHLRDPSRPYRSSILAAYYERFRPPTIHDVFLGGTCTPRGTLASWPTITSLVDVWAVTRPIVAEAKRAAAQASDPPHTGYVGPSDPGSGAHHLQRVIDSYHRITSEGYLPERYGYVTGHFLTRGDDYRFVVGHGNHRMAALRLLGYRHLPVQLRQSHPPIVDDRDLDRWTVARGGLLQPAEAAAVFTRFFEGDGRERARELGLLASERPS